MFLPGAVRRPRPGACPTGRESARRALAIIHQTDGETLVDRAGRPVYYEILINRDAYTYITANRLYDAAAQRRVALSDGIVLPAGPSEAYGPTGTIVIKAAWKVLSPAELAQSPRRFHTAEARCSRTARPRRRAGGASHLNQRVTGFTRRPLGELPASRQRAGGGRGRDGAPLFLLRSRLRPLRRQRPHRAAAEHAGRAGLPRRPLGARDQRFRPRSHPPRRSRSPWQFYELLGVQWPQYAFGLPAPVPDPRRRLAQGVPLSVGTPSTQTLVNPVLETFRQTPNVSCLGCHANGAIAASKGLAPLAADYSFLLGHAQAAARP